MSFKEIVILFLVLLTFGGVFYILRNFNQTASIYLYILIAAAVGIYIEHLRMKIKEKDDLIKRLSEQLKSKE